MTKKCFKCGESKPLTDFYKRPEILSGYRGACKSCLKLQQQECNMQRVEQRKAEKYEAIVRYMALLKAP